VRLAYAGLRCYRRVDLVLLFAAVGASAPVLSFLVGDQPGPRLPGGPTLPQALSAVADSILLALAVLVALRSLDWRAYRANPPWPSQAATALLWGVITAEAGLFFYSGLYAVVSPVGFGADAARFVAFAVLGLGSSFLALAASFLVWPSIARHPGLGGISQGLAATWSTFRRVLPQAGLVYAALLLLEIGLSYALFITLASAFTAFFSQRDFDAFRRLVLLETTLFHAVNAIAFFGIVAGARALWDAPEADALAVQPSATPAAP